MSPTNTHTPLAQESVQLRPPARYISPLHLLRGRRSACTKRRRPGRAGYIASGPPGGGGNRGTAGAWGRVELTLPPNRFGPEDEGPTGWLLRANVIRDQLGGTSFATAKTRSRMDVRSSQSARERGGPSADGPRSLAVGERKGRGERPCAGVDHSLPHWPEPRSPSAGGPTFSPAMLGEAGPLRASVPLVLEGYLEKTPDRSRWCQPGLCSGSLPSPARGSSRAGWSLAWSSDPRSSKQMAWAGSGLFKTRWAREDGGGRAAGRGLIFTARRGRGARPSHRTPQVEEIGAPLRPLQPPPPKWAGSLDPAWLRNATFPDAPCAFLQTGMYPDSPFVTSSQGFVCSGHAVPVPGLLGMFFCAGGVTAPP